MIDRLWKSCESGPAPFPVKVVQRLAFPMTQTRPQPWSRSMTVTTLDATLTRGDTAAPPYANPAEPPMREVRYEYSPGFAADPRGARDARCWSPPTRPARWSRSGSARGSSGFSFHNFERAMGVAVRPDRIAVGSRARGLVPRHAPALVPRLEPARPPRRLLPDPLVPVHRRDPGSRAGLGGRRLVGRQHRLLVPLHPPPRAQLRAPLAAPVRLHARPPRTAATSTAWRWPTASRST